MGQSLAEAAVRGTTSTTEEARKLLDQGDIAGLLALQTQRFGGFKMKLDDADDDQDDDDVEDDDDDDQDDDDDEDDDDDDKGKRKKPTAAERRIQELSAESKKYRLKSVSRGKRVAELEAELEKLKTGGKAKAKTKDADDDEDDSDKDDSEAKRLKQENLQLQERLVRQQLRTEFTDLVTGPKALAQFKNPRAAFKLLDLDDVEIDEDGDIDGLEDAIKALAKDEPYLLADKASKDDEDDDEDDDRPRRRRTGQPTGGGRKKGNPNRDKLVSKYPALRR